MKLVLSLITVLTITSCAKKVTNVKIGQEVPNYTFHEVLNTDKEPFQLQKRGRAVIVEFWATWCSPCLPAMKKLANIQETYGDKIDLVTVSSDSKSNLNRYIDNTNTSLRIAYDTTHFSIFKYNFIPHTVLIDRDGIVQAITTPDRLTDKVIDALLSGQEIEFKESIEHKSEEEYVLNKTFKGKDYQYQLTSENGDKSFENTIERDSNGLPTSLEFSNVSIHRLLADIYELPTVARIYNRDLVSPKRKFCFSLEQDENYQKNLLDHAKEILNENMDVNASMVEMETDSIYVLSVVDQGKLPPKSSYDKKEIQFRGPSYSAKAITSSDLVAYLENEAFLPVKDLTLLEYNFDIELDWNYEDPKTLNLELENYGLKIHKPASPEKMHFLVLKVK